MPKAKKLPSGNWRARACYTDPNGKRCSKSFTASTRKEAEYMVAEFLMHRKHMSDKGKWTLGHAIDEYINIKRPTLAASSAYRYETIRRRSFQDIMDIPLEKLNDDILQAAINKEMLRKPLNRKGTVAPKTIENEFSLISSTIRRFYPDYEFDVDLPKKARRIRSLPLPETIYETVKGTDIELAVLLAMWLSFTMSEIRGLTKSNSIDGDYITIREVVVEVGGVDTIKERAKEDERNRRHRIPPYIKELIDQVEGDVLVTKRPKSINYCFKKCLKQAGIQDMTFHDLRHVSASLMAKLRIPDKYALERGGWKTDIIMKRVYTEIFTDERVNVDDIMDNYFEQFLPQSMAENVAT